ncbi:MAG: metal-dependent hydrolase [Peptococcaceae bacterium]|jgi:inner membrane protein|nr:metal-dependent hydrolase [Peptococcaceae bacterium]MDH7525543.1 metal-dependent hydrolase [Peptococcaceae bacterium]
MMDPVTHALAGLVIGSKAGSGFSLSNGIMMASTLGAIAPDVDIAARFWGDYAYLKQHRKMSHSLPGLAFLALVTGAVLAPFYPEQGFNVLVFWAFFGALSHSLLDLFNSYGVNLLWPLKKEKWSFNLLLIFDPVIFGLCVLLAAAGEQARYNLIALGLIGIYLFIRWLMRLWAHRMVKSRLARRYPQARIYILPSMRYFFVWNFIMRFPGKNVVGTVNVLKRKFKIVRRLHPAKGDLRMAMQESVLGRFFRDFTPFYHVECDVVEDKYVGHFMDLRYLVEERFLHNGTLVLDRDLKVEEAVLQPFSLSRRIELNA